MLNLNNKIKSVLKPYYIDYVGFANLSPYQEELTKLGGSIVNGFSNGISLGIVIPDAIVNKLPNRSDTNVSCEYQIHGYDVLNDRLNLSASVVTSYLNQQGYRTLPIAAANRTDEENALPTVSHKMVAHIAGLGWIGKNCLLITPKHGPRLRLISILTEAPLATLNNPLEQRCEECNECTDICPVGAIKGRNYKLGEPREKRFDFEKCHNYFRSMEKTKKYAVCGLCLYVCPHGKYK